MEDFATPKPRTAPVSRIVRRKSEYNPSPNRPPPYRIMDESVHDSSLKDISGMANPSVLYFDERSDVFLNYSTSDYKQKSLLKHDNLDVLSEENPGVAATENLFVDFLATCAEPTEGPKVLDQVAEFEQLVGDHYDVLKSIISKYPGSSYKFKKSSQVCENLFLERNTWRLLGTLYHDRIGSSEDEKMEEGEITGFFLSEKLIVERLFSLERDLREAQAVVDWCETNAVEGVTEASSLVSDNGLGWENTFNSLVHKKSDFRTASLVKELDPDAPRRTGAGLHDLDVSDNSRLAEMVFRCLRAGMLDSAQLACVKAGQNWRAATFEGWKLFHDPNLTEIEPTGKKYPCEGNKTRDLWKRCAWNLSKDEKMSPLERASYSALCGNSTQLLSVCKTWEDCLWALCRSFVDLKVEEEIRRRSTLRSFAPLPKEYWDENPSAWPLVLEALESLDKEDVKKAKKNSYKIIQTYLISGNYEKLLEKILEWVKDPIDPHLLRLCAHIVLVFRRLKVYGNLDESEDIILQVYVIYLMNSSKVQQVAWYCSQLPNNQQIELYSKFLENIIVYSDRKLCLDLALESELPLEEILVQTVINIWSKEEADHTEEAFVKKFTDSDKIKVDALTWLTFFESQRSEALIHCNTLVRSFATVGKLEAAKAALERMPPNTLNLIVSDMDQMDEEFKPIKVANAVREFLCLRAYLEAEEAFSDWFNHYSKGQPIKPNLMEKASFVEKVAFEQREEQYALEMDRWNSAQLVQSRTATEGLLGVIKFPQGWLLDETEEDSGDESLQRLEELNYLRKTLLPKIVLLLHNVLHSTRQYKEAIAISDLVACEVHGIYKVYSKEQMKDLLGKIRESSLAALEKGSTDPWGYSIS